MGLLNIIRRMHLRQKLLIREIARLTGVSRNTVTKHLAANTIEPKFATPERQSKIDPFADKLAGWLKTEAGKSRKERRIVQSQCAAPRIVAYLPIPHGNFGSQDNKAPRQRADPPAPDQLAQAARVPAKRAQPPPDALSMHESRCFGRRRCLRGCAASVRHNRLHAQ